MPPLARLRALLDERPAFTGLAVAFACFLLAYPALDAWLRALDIAPPFVFWDFGAYGGAVERWLANEQIYERNADGGFFGTYLYPPIVLVLFRPFAQMPYGALAWAVSSLLFLWAGLVAVVQTLTRRLSWPERALGLWLLVGFQPVLLNFKMGQTGAFMAGLLCLAFVAMERGDERRGARLASGATTGVVGVVKFAYAPVGAHLLADRDRFVAAVAAGLGVVALSLLLFGLPIHQRYLEVLAWGVGQGEVARSPALWQAPYFKPLGALGAGALWLRVAGSAVVAGYALLARDADREVFALGVAAFPLLTPLGYTYYLVALLPAAAILVHGEFVHDGRPVVPLLGLVFASLHSYGTFGVTRSLPEVVPWLVEAFPDVYFYLQPGLWGCLLLAGTALVRVAERVEVPERFAEPDGSEG